MAKRTLTADLSHLVWEEESKGQALWPFDNTQTGRSAYEYVGTHNPEPFLIGISNEGLPKRNTESELISACGTTLGSTAGVAGTWNVLSADGRTVYFTATGHDEGQLCPSSAKAPPVYELYARIDGEEPGAHTVAISEPQALNPAAVNKSCETAKCRENTENPAPAVNPNWSDAEFVGASADGSKTFFLDTQQLTDKATEGAGSAAAEGCSSGGADCNLYLYDFAQPEGQRLIDVSASEAGGGSPLVQEVVASAADGSHVYFVANGVLASRATPGNCHFGSKEAEEDKCNLYVYERDARYPEGHIAFIASVPGSDDSVLGWLAGANVTPDGRFLVFESHGDLTPDAHAGGVQIFRYDAASGQLVRISIGNDGFNDNGNAGTGDASIVLAGYEGEGHVGPVRGDPTMSNDGSYVFFQSPVGLTPHALNDVVTAGHFAATEYAQNVYEWHGGHVYLISDGRDVSNANVPCGSGSAVCLLGSDATGSNVFFMTADRLVPVDTDTQVDIYDARICEPAGGNPCIAPAPAQLPPCGGEACHGIPAGTPSLLAPGTASFNGEGNLVLASPPSKKVTKKAVQCKRGSVKRHNKCIKSKKKTIKAKKAKRATNDRRAKS